MAFEFTTLSSEFHVGSIVTAHYFEYSANFRFEGESHDFWEFLYVDKGSVDVLAGDSRLSLQKDQIIFHKPGEFHAVYANGVIAPNLVVLSFVCNDPAMAFFDRYVATISPELRGYLHAILEEATQTFCSDLSDPYITRLERVAQPPFGGEQMIRTLLEQFLIGLHRAGEVPNNLQAGTPIALPDNNKVFQNLVQYLENNLHRSLTLETICRDNLISVSYAQKLFKRITQGGIIAYHNRMKIDHAKVLIRQENMNFTQIAQALGYTSIHYFSKQFKRIANMTPTEYSRSVL